MVRFALRLCVLAALLPQTSYRSFLSDRLPIARRWTAQRMVNSRYLVPVKWYEEPAKPSSTATYLSALDDDGISLDSNCLV